MTTPVDAGGTEQFNVQESLDALEALLAQSVQFSQGMTTAVINNDMLIQIQNKVGSSFGKIQ